MADETHLAVLMEAIEKDNIRLWNEWKKSHPGGVDLTYADLVGLLSKKEKKRHPAFAVKGLRTQLPGIDLSGASMWRSDLEFVDLPGANLRGADLGKANFRRANLSSANLRDAHLYEADFYQASLASADLSGARLTLLRHEKIRDVIQTLGQKAVLILGRFTPDRKEVLDAVAEQLRGNGYLPIIFDFERSSQRDFTETIKILAGLSLFVIADITKPSSSPLELDATVPDYMIPFVPIIQKGESPFAMFANLQNKYSWVMDVREYKDKQELLDNLEKSIIRPAVQFHNELIVRRAEGLRIRPVTDSM